MSPNLSTDMIKKLSGREKIFVDSFLEMIALDKKLLEKVCGFIAGKTNYQGLVTYMKALSGEGQVQACEEFIIIGLISGSIKVKELSAIVDEYTLHQPLISSTHV